MWLLVFMYITIATMKTNHENNIKKIKKNRTPLFNCVTLLVPVENRNTMRELEGMSKLLDFLSKPEWNDLHVMVVMVISSLLEDVECLEVGINNSLFCLL